LRKYGTPISVLFEGREIPFAKEYLYLGLLFSWNATPLDMWKARDSAAVKALGCFKTCMTGFFFLPFSRICSLLCSLVYSVYIYGAELWAPFAATSTVGSLALQWLVGIHGIRIKRLQCWLPLKRPDDMAMSRAICVVFEAAQGKGGLLADTVGQFVRNYELAGAGRRDTWYGRLLFACRKVWPHFSISLTSATGFTVEGVPFDWSELPLKEIAARYAAECTLASCRARYNALVAQPPGPHQQDLILHAILLRIRCSDPLFYSTIFMQVPDVSHYLLRDLLILLSGTGNFGRVTAHYELRKRTRNPVPLQEGFKRKCLLCSLHLFQSAELEELPLDSEWHMLFGCGTTSSALHTYKQQAMALFPSRSLPWEPSLESLVVHTLLARAYPDLFRSFLKFISASFSLRHKAWSRVNIATIRSAFGELSDG
jgi:hypothetical protein